MRFCSAVVRVASARTLARNGDAERAAFAECGVDADLAAMALDDALGQIQTVARSTAARLIQLQAEIMGGAIPLTEAEARDCAEATFNPRLAKRLWTFYERKVMLD